MASLKKLETGWQFRVSYKDGPKYRTKSGNGYPTKKDALAAAAEIEQRCINSEYQNSLKAIRKTRIFNRRINKQK